MDHYYNNVFKRSHESISGGSVLDNEVDQKLRKLALDLARERQSSGLFMNELQMNGMTKPSGPQLPAHEYQRMMNNMNNGFADASNGSTNLQAPSMMDMQKTFMMMMQQQQLQQARQPADSSHIHGAAMFNVAGSVKPVNSSANVFHERSGISAQNPDRGDCASVSGSTSMQRQQSTHENSSCSPAHQEQSQTVDEKLLDTQMKMLKQQEMFFERVVELVSMATTLVHGVVMKYGLPSMDQPIPDQSRNLMMSPFVVNNSAKTFAAGQHPLHQASAGAAKGLFQNLMQPVNISNGKVAMNPAYCGLPNSAPYFSGGVPLPTSSGFNPSFNDALNPRRPRPSIVVGHPVHRNFVSSFNDCRSLPVESTVTGSVVTPVFSKSLINTDNTVKAISLSPNATSSPSISSSGLERLTSTASEIVSKVVPPVFVMISPNSIKKE